MNVCSTEDIRKKEIINLCDGARLGCATDFEINVCDAKILALIIPSGGWFNFGKGDNIIIPWEKIECIGEDAVLVCGGDWYSSCGTCKESRKRKCGWFF